MYLSDCDAYLKKSLFLVGEIGGNDYTVGGFLAGRTMQQVEAFVPLVVDTIINTTIVRLMFVLVSYCFLVCDFGFVMSTLKNLVTSFLL